jgi:RNA polymerase sigma-54 factor
LTDSGWSSIGSGSSRGFDSGEFSLEAMLSHEPTLSEHLSEQLVLAISDPVRRVIGQHLIHLIDDDGYLRTDLGELADQLGTSVEQIEEVLKVMQGFEPVGVFGRDLAECLAIQLKEKDRLDPAMQGLLANIDLLARREFSALRKICSVDEEDLADMIAEIRRLDPRPAQQFTAHIAEPVVPDVIVQPKADGTWHVELNADTLPRVLVSQSYYATVAKGAKNAKDKAYLSDCLQSANWLVKSIDQRARTILKVASEIVRQQDAFLIYGVEHLRPLTLRAIADAISMHESTISRVTSNKYMATPRGIFELKFFFTTAISSADGGEAHSAEAVRHKIRQMIDREAANAVLSDDQLVRQLRAEGVDIARRTVAKYRESLKIPSSVQRRREKRQPA